MNTEARRDLQALDAIADNDRITQRRLSLKLGIALGLTNLYLKRLVHKGYVKCVNIQSNRIRYLITLKGIAEKTRLTYEFMDYSLHLYGQVRQQLREILKPLAGRDRKRVALYGSGEAAELAYMSILEMGLDLVAVFDDEKAGTFLGHPVLDRRECDASAFDLLIVSTLEKPRPIVEMLVQMGVPPEKLVVLRDDRNAAPATRNGPGSRRSKTRE